MYARRSRSLAGRRRGVVLILVLAMMGLLAVIGVSFATFSGQARSGAITYSTRLSRPRPDAMIEYAVEQLINDTTNPMSALFGHGLKSDMYGNDAVRNGLYVDLRWILLHLTEETAATTAIWTSCARCSTARPATSVPNCQRRWGTMRTARS